jgi:hypothetical protein
MTQNFNDASVIKYQVTRSNILQNKLNAMVATEIRLSIGVPSVRSNHVLQKKDTHTVSNVIVFHARS